MSGEWITGVLALGVVYIAGYGHGSWMAYTTPVRFRRWAETSCTNVYESVMATYEKGAPK